LGEKFEPFLAQAGKICGLQKRKMGRWESNIGGGKKTLDGRRELHKEGVGKREKVLSRERGHE